MKTIHILILLMTVSLLSACEMLGSKSENSPTEDMPLTGTSWWLQSYQDEKGKRSESTMDDIKLVFTDSDTLQGQAHHKNTAGEVVSANSYIASYSIANSSIIIQDGISTHVGTPSGSRYSEYLVVLNGILTYKIQGDRLIIFYSEDGGKALHFKAEENIDSLE